MVKNLTKIYGPMRWQNMILILAGVYNLAWGTWIILSPLSLFELLNMPTPQYPEIWQCVGMIVGVYGLGYLIAAKSPLHHWPIVLVGFLGKIFGPIGFAKALFEGIFPLQFGINIIFNDLIWWIPFGMILYQAYKKNQASQSEMIHFSEEDFKNFESRKRARFINSLSGFKSSNLVGTMDGNGQTNLSIISSAFHLGANPALIGFIIRPDVAPRHTLDNLRETRFCTLNHVNSCIIREAHQTSARYPLDQSEFDACQLEEQYMSGFPAPFVKEAHIKMALELVREIKIEENGTHFLILKIKDVYLPKDCLNEDGLIDIEAAGTIAASGLDSYHLTNHVGRLEYAKPDKEADWL